MAQDGDDIWGWLVDSDAPSFVGALGDTGASGSFIGPGDWDSAVNCKSTVALEVATGNGGTVVDKCGDLPGSGGLITSAPYLKDSPETLLSIGETCEKYAWLRRCTRPW